MKQTTNDKYFTEKKTVFIVEFTVSKSLVSRRWCFFGVGRVIADLDVAKYGLSS